MSEEQPGSEQSAKPAQLEQQTGDRWGDPIAPEQADELKRLADQQRAWAAASDHQNRESYFKFVQLTAAEVFWLAAYAVAGPDGNLDAAKAELRAQPQVLAGLHLEGANLGGATLEGAYLRGATLEGAYLAGAHLEGANLTGSSFDKTSRVRGAVLTGASLDQVTYDNVNLTVVDWSVVPVLGDELTAKNARDEDGKRKVAATRRGEYAAAVRANRVLAVTLRGQGLNEDADRYAYRAQLLQRVLLRRQRKWGRWLGTGLLDVISGYGYKPLRSVFTYVLVIVAFAALYFALGGAHGQALTWNESLVVSLTAFHGRGFFATAFQPGDPQAAVAAIEAVLGLLFEITFIATFTNRFFAR